MWHDIEQNTPEWDALRAGKVTGSAIAKIMASVSEEVDSSWEGVIDIPDLPAKKNVYEIQFKKKRQKKKFKSFGEPAKKLAVDIAIHRLTGRVNSDNYMSMDMLRGHEQEPIARALYEEQNFVTVDNGGFYDNGKTGCSPDGNVNHEGLVEIKSVIGSTHFKTIKSGKPDTSYRWQYSFNLKETGRDWLDFVSYCSEFPEDNQIFEYRLLARDLSDDFELIDERLVGFFELVDDCVETIGNSKEAS